MKNKPFYITQDGVKVYDGDNFYSIKDESGTLRITYWDCNVMASFTKNKVYLDNDKLKFSSKDKLKEYIIKNNLVVSNFNLIFVV